MTSISQIPFELNRASLEQWLEKLDSPDPLLRGYELYKLLNQIKKDHLSFDVDELVSCVNHLTQVAVPVLEFLHRDLLNGHEALSVKQYKEARLSIALLDLLAFLNGYLTGLDSDKSEKIEKCNMALQMLCLSDFQCALSYNRTSAEKWRILADIYQLSAAEGILDAPVVAVFQEFRRLSTLESVLKFQLLFAICQPLHFSRTELPVLLDFCIEQHDKLQLSRLGRYSGEGFFWSFSDAKPPIPVSAISGNTGLPFNIDNLVKAARNRELELEGFDAQTFWDVATHYKVFSDKTYLPALAFPCVFAYGFDQICLFFQSHVRDGVVSRITSPSPNKVSLSTIELVREESKNKNALAHVLAEDIWGKPAESQIKKVHFAAIKAFNTDRPNFIAIESIKSDLFDRDIVVLYQADMAPKLAIVRRVEPVKLLNGNTKALLEIVPGEVSVDAAGLGAKSKLVLLLKRGKFTELIAESGQFATGTIVELEQGSFRLLRLIEETDYFVRYLVMAL
ncbi:MAG: hypothetical protein ACU85E_17555 [Gammaproteobacteria bacterium]